MRRMTRLDELRAELGTIDKELLKLAARRQAAAQEIGRIKRDAGIPVRDFRQERDVVERAPPPPPRVWPRSSARRSSSRSSASR
jgi:chorismate mutase